MNFETFFRSISYAAVLGGFLALWVSGTFGLIATALFFVVMIAAWFLEDSRWQISERIGTSLIVLSLPAYYLAFEFQLISFAGSEALIAGVLARMILTLSAIKLLQKKGERDWVFLYLMAFFEVLLGAGLSISLPYLAAFIVYLGTAVSAVIAFEIRRTGEMFTPEDDTVVSVKTVRVKRFPLRSLPLSAAGLIVAIAIVAVPLFFLLPRVGGAGLGGYQNSVSTMTGFSDRMQLGSIGRIQQNDAIVMRVTTSGRRGESNDLYFRGVALDTFDGKTWSGSRQRTKEQFLQSEDGQIHFGDVAPNRELLEQTILLEPLDTPVIFAVPRAVAISGNTRVLYRDSYGSLSVIPTGERTTYKAFSDIEMPTPARLRLDDNAYPTQFGNYLQLPSNFDTRIAELAATAIRGTTNRFDRARAIEKFLITTYGYTLEMQAGGDDPLADFLFRTRQGHCEYFATAMAMMLRSQGIASRVVNGFHTGEFNDRAGMYIVRQRHAHAWVEVYFPDEGVWTQFDPTPASNEGSVAGGFTAEFGKYLEALDAIWIQYFVAFDDQGQGAMSRSFLDRVSGYSSRLSSVVVSIESIAAEWWREARGERGVRGSLYAVGILLGSLIGAVFFLLVVIWLSKRIRRSGFWERFGNQVPGSNVQFYREMEYLLAQRGMKRSSSQTPLEFASETGLREVVHITEQYNKARFGNVALSNIDRSRITDFLADLRNRA